MRLMLGLIVFILVLPALAQTPRIIVEDDVTRIAQRLYCPVCENIPLDDCGTTTCIAWKQEIGEMLAQGMSDEAIISDFVARYGEKVIGIPQNETLRAMALGLPLLGLLLASIAAALTFSNWEKRKNAPQTAETAPIAHTTDDYRQQFERDV